jgi:hypothetical protein
VTPAPNISHPKVIKDLRKISGTSDFSKVFEDFLKDWIMEDVAKNIDILQFGGQPGIGTEHLVVCLMDRILKLLDRYPDRSAVIMTCLDWSAAFDRQDPTLAIMKFIKLEVRPSLIPLLVSYLTDRRMQVKFNGELSEFLALIGGGPQGTLLGQIEYLVQSNDNADIVSPDDRYKYIVAADVGIDDQFLPADAYQTQDSLNYIANWTAENKMKINEDKCNFMIFSRSEEKFATRLALNEVKLDQVHESKMLGL